MSTGKSTNSDSDSKPQPAISPSRLRVLAFGLGVVILIAAGVYYYLVFNQRSEQPGAQNGNGSTAVDTGDTGDTNFEYLATIEQQELAVSSQLKKISEKFQTPAGIETELLGQFVAPGFESTGFSPEQLQQVHQSSGLNVWCLESGGSAGEEKLRGEPGFLSVMRQLVKPIVHPQDVDAFRMRSKFKVFRIDDEGDEIRTAVLASFVGRSSNSRSGEFNATIDIVWVKPSSSNGKPLVQSMEVDQYECVTYAGSSASGFTDCTMSFLGGDENIAAQMAPGSEAWSARIPQHSGLGQYGLAVGDVNGDGLDDVYYCQPYGLPNRLLVQQPDGTTRDMAGEWNVDLCDHTRSALIIDLDNDGYQDLVVGAQTFVAVYRNNQNRGFELKQNLFEARNGYSMAAADYDGDGDLDFYVCSYDPLTSKSSSFPFAYPMHDANNGGRNVLYRNQGNWEFQDVTSEVGLDQDNRRFSLAVGWQDYDNDGDPDLYVANDFGRNCFYENENGTFRNRAAELQVEDQSFGMSVDWGDVNQDGWMDLYVSNMYSTAGNRVTHQANYLSKRPELQDRMQYMARGNTLFLGGAKGFEDAGGRANVFMGRWAWGAKFVDLNNDSWEDIVVANGYLTRESTDDL